MNFKKTAKVIIFTQLLLAVLLFNTNILHAQEEFVVDSVITDIIINPNGTLDVTETATYNFNDKFDKGPTSYPVTYISKFEKDILEKESITQAFGTDEKGNVYKMGFEYSSENNEITRFIYVDDTGSGLKKLVVKYKASNFIKYDTKQDFIPWKQFLVKTYHGPKDLNDKELIILKSQLNITFPTILSGHNFDIKCIQKPEANLIVNCVSYDQKIENNKTIFNFYVDNSSRGYTQIDTVIPFDKGIVVPEKLWIENNHGNIIYFCIAAALFAFIIFLLWYFIKYLPLYKSRQKPVITQYEPPRGLTPAQVGLVYLRKADLGRLVTSEMALLSDLGYLTINKKQRGNYAQYIFGYIFLAFIAIVFLGIFSFVSIKIGNFVFSSKNYSYYVTFILIMLSLLRNLFLRFKRYLNDFIVNQNILDFTFNEAQNGKVVPDHLRDLIDFLRITKSNPGANYFYYKRILRDFFNRVLLSLPKDHLEERSIFSKKYYKARKKRSFSGKVSIVFWILFLTWPIIFISLFFLSEIGFFHFISMYPKQVLYMIYTVIFIRLLFIYKKYLINKIFYKTTLWYEVMGFRKYIDTAEEDRIKFANDPNKSLEVYSRYLPYAIIFGLEKKWKALFTSILGIGN